MRRKRLSMEVKKLPTIIYCPAVIDVGEEHTVRVVQTYHCNCTGADRVMYGKKALSAKLVTAMTREMVAQIDWLPLEDECPWDPADGGC